MMKVIFILITLNAHTSVNYTEQKFILLVKDFEFLAQFFNLILNFSLHEFYALFIFSLKYDTENNKVKLSLFN